MSGPHRRHATLRRVAVVRALPGLGDMLCAVPALRALRAAAPAAEVTVVGLAGAAWFADRFPHYVDGFLPCPVWPGLAEIDGPRRSAERFLAVARRHRFDLAIQMHGDGRASNGLTASLGAASWAGLALDPVRSADGRGVVGSYRTDRHEVDRCLDALAVAGIPAGDPGLEFPVTPDEVRAAERMVAPGRRFAVVHPGSSTASRRWSPIGFGRVVEHLLERVDRVVLTGGGAERTVTSAVCATVRDRHRLVDLAGATSLGELGALMHRADVVVANDTGAAHLASAVGVPAVTVCGPSDRARWAPRGPADRAVGGDPHGRWPTAHEVRAAVDGLLVAERSGC